MDAKQLVQTIKVMQGGKTQLEFSRMLSCSAAYLSDVYSGKREPGPKILKALGYTKHTIYKKWRKDD